MREEAKQREETTEPMQEAAAGVVAAWNQSQEAAERRRVAMEGGKAYVRGLAMEGMRTKMVMAVRGWRAVVEAKGARPVGLKLIWVGEEMKYSDGTWLPEGRDGTRRWVCYAESALRPKVRSVRSRGTC